MREYGLLPIKDPPQCLSDFRLSDDPKLSDVVVTPPQTVTELFTTGPIEPRDMLIVGAVGAGKSYLAVAYARALWMRFERRVIYFRVQDYLALQFSRDGHIQRVLEDAQHVPILVIDDLAAEAEIKGSVERVCDLLSAREELGGRGATIVTSNITSPSGIREHLGERIADRVSAYTPVVCKRPNDESRRKVKRGQIKQL